MAFARAASAAALSGPATWDPKAEASLRRVETTLRRTRTLTADYIVSKRWTGNAARGAQPAGEVRERGALRLMRPNLLRAERQSLRRSASPQTNVWIPTGPPLPLVSDGKTRWTLLDATRFRKDAAAPDGTDLEAAALPDALVPVRGFFAFTAGSYLRRAQTARQRGELVQLRHAGRQTWEGEQFEVVLFTIKDVVNGAPHTETTRLYVGGDGIIRRVVSEYRFGDMPGRSEHVLRNVQVGAPLRATDFAFRPPAGAREHAVPALLAAGTLAPDFTARDTAGKPVKLSDFRGKVVVLDFWATWCLPCLQSFPHTAAVAKKTAALGVVVLAVNVWDNPAAFKAWVGKHPEFDALTFVVGAPLSQGQDVAALYHLSSIPVQYVIGRDGKIMRSLVGYGGPTPDLENAIRAAAATAAAGVPVHRVAKE
jgi:thiol-disulfide isomerase/thioredoxin